MIANKDYVAEVFLRHWLCIRPYAADDYSHGIYRMMRDKALTKKHIQCNPGKMQSIIVVDVDDKDGMSLCLWDVPCRPNLIIENTDNGHVHAIWFLKTPVCTSQDGREAPKRYLNAVTKGLQKLVNGDPAYVQLMMKNPLHKQWDVMVVDDREWTLGELCMHLKAKDCMPEPEPHLNEAAELLGRNCTLFDYVRKWAYRAVRKFLDSYDRFKHAILEKLNSLNAEFTHRLSDGEVYGIAKSISKWVWKSDLRKKSQEEYDKTFSRIQSARSAMGRLKSIAARQSRFNMFKNDILSDPSLLVLSAKTLAKKYHVSASTIYRWLKTLKAHPSTSEAISEGMHRVSDHSMVLSDHSSASASSQHHTSSSSNFSSSAYTLLSDLDKWKNDSEDSSEELEDDSWVECIDDDGVIDSFRLCPECMSPIWGFNSCTCMLEDDED